MPEPLKLIRRKQVSKYEQAMDEIDAAWRAWSGPTGKPWQPYDGVTGTPTQVNEVLKRSYLVVSEPYVPLLRRVMRRLRGLR